jgi:hypothetical protein
MVAAPAMQRHLGAVGFVDACERATLNSTGRCNTGLLEQE